MQNNMELIYRQDVLLIFDVTISCIKEEIAEANDEMFKFILNNIANMYTNIRTIISGVLSVDAEPVITGETSDGYHTFNELYHHRAILFSVIVKAFPDKAWKSRKHHDGTMYDGMFIVGIETPDGQATYHYDIEPYWDMFCCKEVEFAPEWDGHTPLQAIERIGKLEPVRHGKWKHEYYPIIWYGNGEPPEWVCSECQDRAYNTYDYCPNCGAKMDKKE